MIINSYETDSDARALDMYSQGNYAASGNLNYAQHTLGQSRGSLPVNSNPQRGIINVNSAQPVHFAMLNEHWA